MTDSELLLWCRLWSWPLRSIGMSLFIIIVVTSFFASASRAEARHAHECTSLHTWNSYESPGFHSDFLYNCEDEIYVCMHMYKTKFENLSRFIFSSIFLLLLLVPSLLVR